MSYKQGDKVEFDGGYYYVIRDEGDVLRITDIPEDVDKEFASGWFVHASHVERVGSLYD